MFREKIALALHNPRFIGRSAWYAFGKPVQRFPITLAINLTDRCNFSCPMCLFAESRKSRQQIAPVNIPLSLVDKACREAAAYGTIIHFLGGEPLLYDHLAEAVTLASRRNCCSQMVSNSLLLPEAAETLVGNGLHALWISIDGWDDESQALRGNVRRSFRAILEGIEQLKRLRGGRPFPSLRVFTAITRNNFHSLHRIQGLLFRLGVSEWKLIHYNFITASVMSQHAQFVLETGIGDHVAAQEIGDQPYLNPDQAEALCSSLNTVRRNAAGPMRRMRILFPWRTDVRRYYSTATPGAETTCRMWIDRADLQTDGRIAACMDAYTLGDLNTETIFACWNGERMNRLRQVMAERFPFPMCFRCCGATDGIRFQD